MEHATQTIFTVLILLPLNLVVGLLSAGRLRLHCRTNNLNVPVQATSYPIFEFPLGYVMNLSHTLGSVEVHRTERQVHVINRHKLSARALLLVVPPHLHKLATTQRQLGKQLLLLVTELLNLIRQLPVHVVSLAFCNFSLLAGHITKDVSSGRTIWRE